MVLTERQVHNFWDRVEKRDGCWPWQGAVAPNGYGLVNCLNHSGRRSTAGAHRVAYELERGPIPDGLELDHLCRNSVCVNPAHLEPVTHQENVRRMWEALDALS